MRGGGDGVNIAEVVPKPTTHIYIVFCRLCRHNIAGVLVVLSSLGAAAWEFRGIKGKINVVMAF